VYLTDKKRDGTEIILKITHAQNRADEMLINASSWKEIGKKYHNSIIL